VPPPLIGRTRYAFGRANHFVMGLLGQLLRSRSGHLHHSQEVNWASTSNRILVAMRCLDQSSRTDSSIEACPTKPLMKNFPGSHRPSKRTPERWCNWRSPSSSSCYRTTRLALCIVDRNALDASLRDDAAPSAFLGLQGFQPMRIIHAQCTDQLHAACMHHYHRSWQRIEIIIIDHHRERIIG